MNSAQITDERLKTALNSNQPSRERLCLGILALDRNYTDIIPRCPEGGPDGGRDIECIRNGEKCFGAVGFKNNANDSAQHKKDIQKKFKNDILAAHRADEMVKAFVFLCNINLTPGEINDLIEFARNNNFTTVDIYHRERLRIALDSVDGFALRFQYLNINLSDAEQKAFFSRFGKELEDILHGKFDRIERKLDEIEFAQWKSRQIKSLKLELRFKNYINSIHEQPEHFRVALELQCVGNEKYSMVLGGRDGFWAAKNGKYYFDTKSFFWHAQSGKIEDSWIKNNSRIGGGVISGITLGANWLPISPIFAYEFENLLPHLHLTENLVDRLSHIQFSIDDYIIFDMPFTLNDLATYVLPGWPEELTNEELNIKWLCKMICPNIFTRIPKKKSLQ